MLHETIWRAPLAAIICGFYLLVFLPLAVNSALNHPHVPPQPPVKRRPPRYIVDTR